jgi:serine/threonine protein kinase
MPEVNPKKAALKASAAQMARILDAGGAEMLDGGLPELLSLKAGQQVGARRFTLVKPLGRGGMGVVWLAQDTRLDESVALKFLPTEIASDPVALNDLRRETVRSHHLTHPNIIRIHDFHQTDDVAFISMEYVDGATLSDRRLQQTRQVLTWEQLAPLVEQLCAALEYAHSEKVIHRDLKPSNMMVDSKGRLKLADFGIAAVASDSMSKASVQHATSGTPPYMSPQQLAGKRPQVTDDIYALGATLYELLTGKPPFYTGDITHQVMNQTPEPMDCNSDSGGREVAGGRRFGRMDGVRRRGL